MFTELLAPAGDLDCFKQAIYNGADAVYLATERFGARAYAKNLSLDELKEALILAHEIHKKIYVTVNTNLKENEIEDCKKYIRTLYEYGVDGLILADFSMINYVIEHCPNMEAHISTQVGLKDLNDVYFMQKLGAKRCVLAREVSFEEIKKIKETVNMPLEIFAHGALCVSYSGGCLFSSMLSLRSGNRGRCAQNCRREYTLYKDGKKIEKGFHLSMRDLNTSFYLKDLQNIGVDSLKIEGRMKDPEYVKITVSEYRKKMDNPSYNPKSLDTIFHRNYTKGFLFNEDKGQIVDITKRTKSAYITPHGDIVTASSQKFWVSDYTLVNGQNIISNALVANYAGAFIVYDANKTKLRFSINETNQYTYQEGDYYVRFGDTGENKLDIETRLSNFLIDVSKTNYNNVLIVSHGSVISYMKRLLNIKSSHIQKGKVEIFNDVNFDDLFNYYDYLKRIK
jgi:collagenase-like PrtC family protease